MLTPPAANVTVGILIPVDSIARVIGKQGAGLKQIRERSGCKVSAEAGESLASVRRVELTGNPNALGIGLVPMMMNAYKDQVSVKVTIMVPSELTGTVIGRGGENLRRIREALAVRIEVEKAPVVNVATGAQERMVTFSGAPTMIGRALSMALGVTISNGMTSPVNGQAQAFAFNFGALGVGNIGTPNHLSELGLVPGVASSFMGRPEDAQVRPASEDPDDVQVHIVIPGKLTGAIVGKEGVTIKELAGQSGCNLSVTNRSNSSQRRVICRGEYCQCIAAQRLLYTQIVAAAAQASIDMSVMTVIFWVPSEVSGAVIGKGGATLGQIREQTGVKLQFPKEEVLRQRPCSIIGPMQNILQAEAVIFQLVHAERMKLGPTKRLASAVLEGDVKRLHTGSEKGQTKLLVPARSAGAIIGKQGSGLCRIREECNIKIDMLQHAQAPHWPEDRVVILQGPWENCLNAMQAVLLAAYQTDESNATLKMLVTGGEAGAIIGKQGSTLKALREQSGISTQVEKNDIFGERLVTASGPLASILGLVEVIIHLLRLNQTQAANNLGFAENMLQQ